MTSLTSAKMIDEGAVRRSDCRRQRRPTSSVSEVTGTAGPTWNNREQATADSDHRADDGERSRPQPRSGGEAVAADSNGKDSASTRNSTANRSKPMVGHQGDTLTDWITLYPPRLLPTPAARDWKGSAGDAESEEDLRRSRGQGGASTLNDASRVDWGSFEPAIRGWERVLGRAAPSPTDERGRLNPVFVEWMMGFPSGWVDGLPRTGQLKALGNAACRPRPTSPWPSWRVAREEALHGGGQAAGSWPADSVLRPAREAPRAGDMREAMQRDRMPPEVHHHVRAGRRRLEAGRHRSLAGRLYWNRPRRSEQGELT